MLQRKPVAVNVQNLCIVTSTGDMLLTMKYTVGLHNSVSYIANSKYAQYAYFIDCSLSKDSVIHLASQDNNNFANMAKYCSWAALATPTPPLLSSELSGQKLASEDCYKKQVNVLQASLILAITSSH